MSVLERTKSRVVERAIPAGESGEVGVRVERGGNIVIKWVCGDSRTFTSDELGAAIDDVEILAEHFPDVWYEGRDTRGSRFYAQLADGELYANTGPDRQSSHVSWAELKRALRKMQK